MSRRRRLAQCLAPCFVLGLATSQLACLGPGTNRIVRTAVPAGIEETLRALNDPENQELMRRLANSPELRQAAHDFTEAITGGALDGLTEPARHQKIRELSEAYVRTMSAALGKALDEDISPAATRTVESITGGAIAAAVSPENKRLTASFVDGVARSAMNALMQSTARGLRDDLGPALGKVIAEDLSPALKKMIADDLGPALNKVIAEDLKPAVHDLLGPQTNVAIGGLVRQITKDAVLGANDGMSELGISLSPNVSRDGLGMFGWLTLVLGLIVTILVLMLVRTIYTRRSLEQERARSEHMLLNILRTIQYTDTDDPAKKPDLDALIARARINETPDPTHDSWWNNLLARARIPSGPSKPPS
jgi:hypothetical protein